MKKVLSMILIVAMLISMMTFISFAETTYVEISSEEQLRAVANDLSGNYILTSDLTLSSPVYIDSNDSAQFTGTFDGNGHTITFTFTDYATAPIFWTIGSAGVVKNLTIDGWKTGGSMYCILAERQNGTISNVHFKNIVIDRTGADTAPIYRNESTAVIRNTTVDANSTITGTADRTGGIASKNYGIIESCVNYATINSATYGGGIVGANETGGRVRLCSNYGTVNGSNMRGGGIAGCSVATASVYGCFNFGTIFVGTAGGGIVGLNENATVDRCVNYGDIKGLSQIQGGVVGINKGTTATVSNSINYGTVVSVASYATATGFGFDENNATVTYTNCFNAGYIINVVGNNGVNNIAGIHHEYMLSDTATVTETNCYSLANRLYHFVTKPSDLASYDLDSIDYTDTAIVTPVDNSANAYASNGSVIAETYNWSTLAEALGSAFKVNTGADADQYPILVVIPETTPDADTDTVTGYQYKLVGAQVATAGSTYSVRFVGILDTLTDLSNVGFLIEASVGDTTKTFDIRSQGYVYKTISAKENGVNTEITAEALGGNYIYAGTITDIPVNEGESITFKVTPYTVALNSDEINSYTAYNVVFVGGVFQSATVVAD